MIKSLRTWDHKSLPDPTGNLTGTVASIVLKNDEFYVDWGSHVEENFVFE